MGSSNLAQRHFSASMRLLHRVGEGCARLPELGQPHTMAELAARARIVRSAINARALFEDFNKHLAGLSEALAEYQLRKDELARHEPPTPQVKTPPPAYGEQSTVAAVVEKRACSSSATESTDA